jgi:hypothetical protein
MSSGFTTVSYGNITLYRCATRQVNQEEILDPSGTDLRYMQTTVTVEGRLNGHDQGTQWLFSQQSNLTQYSLTYAGGADTPNGLASIREASIRYQLPPRQVFLMQVGCDQNGGGGQTLISAKPAPLTMTPVGPRSAAVNMNVSGVDLNNGPHCKSFVITKIVGDEQYTVEATFVVCKVECDSNGNVNGNTKGILYNRWSCQDTMDANLRTSRVYSGQLALTSANLNMQQLRWLVIPPIVQIFRRDNIMVAASEDGLLMNWSVTDTEIAQAAPYPARTWSVRHTQSAKWAMFGESTIDVHLTGDSNVNKGDLLELALYIVTAKMFGTTPPNLNNLAVKPAAFWAQFNITNIELVDVIGDTNEIMARVSVKKTMTGLNGFAIVGDVAQKFGQPFGPTDFTNSAYARDQRPPYNRAYSWGGVPGDSPPYASPAASIVGIFACYLQSPCNDTHQTANPSSGGGGQATNQAIADLNLSPLAITNVPYTATIVPSLAPADTTNPYLSTNSDSTSNAYTYWQLENIYVNNALNVQMPIASAPQRSGYNYSNTCSVVSLSQGVSQRIVRVKAERVGLEPQFPNQWNIPNVISQSSGNPTVSQFFLKSKIRPCTPVITPFGQQIFRADAEYVLALNRMPNPGEQLALGNDIWSNLGSQVTNANGALTNSSWG